MNGNTRVTRVSDTGTKMANSQTGSPDQRAAAASATNGAEATLEAARRTLQTPPAAEQPVMVLLVDDQAIVAEAILQALSGEDGIDFH